MAKAPKIVLTGASGWFGQSFIHSFIKKYGHNNIQNLYMLTSDGRDIHHKVLDHTFQTSALKDFKTSKQIDLFVQSAFLTRDKIKEYGEEKYKKFNTEIIKNSQILACQLKPKVRVLISSGAAKNVNDIYGQLKAYEEECVLNSDSTVRVIFRVYGAMGVNTPLLEWSAISDLVSSANKFNFVSVKSSANVVRGYVSFEKLSELILKISKSNAYSREICVSAVEHSNNLKEIAQIISQVKKCKLKNKDDDFRKLPNIYTADPIRFLNLLDEFDVRRTSIYEEICQTMTSPHLK